MDELLAKLHSEFDEAEGWIRIIEADRSADDLRLSLSVSMHDESQPEIWELTCTAVVEESISFMGD